jgi:nucleotide-binding universal stress UspA family protein
MKTLLVNCEFSQSNDLVLRAASDLAERFQMRVIGICVSQPVQVIYGDYYISTEAVEEDINEVNAQMAAVEQTFRTALASRASQLEWRPATVFASTAEQIAQEARAADLIMTAVPATTARGGQRQLNMGDLVLQAGRPVMIVPASPCATNFDHIVIAWKDAREARRAALDALPLLKKAARVSVVEIADDSQLVEVRRNLDDVSRWLKMHGVIAETIAVKSIGHDAQALEAIAQKEGADLIVAGAYGHSRLREWAFGGFTSELMQPTQRCSFVSH